MTKSECACRRTILSMVEGESDLFMWTFTFKRVVDVRLAAGMWRRLLTDGLNRCVGMRGVRVFELHPGGHGLHVHVITPDRVDVSAVRQVTQATREWGRIHVKRVPAKAALYVAKYLSKERPQAFRGLRLWAAFGAVERVRCMDVTDALGPVAAEMRLITLFDLVSRFPSEDLSSNRKRSWWRYQLAMERIFSPRFVGPEVDLDDVDWAVTRAIRQFDADPVGPVIEGEVLRVEDEALCFP